MSSISVLKVSRLVRAHPNKAYEVVVNVERFPVFMSNVTSVTVLSSFHERKIVAWQMMIDDAPLNWTEEILYDGLNLRATFRSLNGVFDRFDGYWQVKQLEKGSLVEVNVEYELGIPEIECIIAPVLRDRLENNLESMLSSIEREVA
jgi:ribosome-associated toxin RatA of RatAB toxin-antitoxin module